MNDPNFRLIDRQIKDVLTRHGYTGSVRITFEQVRVPGPRVAALGDPATLVTLTYLVSNSPVSEAERAKRTGEDQRLRLYRGAVQTIRRICKDECGIDLNFPDDCVREAIRVAREQGRAEATAKRRRAGWRRWIRDFFHVSEEEAAASRQW